MPGFPPSLSSWCPFVLLFLFSSFLHTFAYYPSISASTFTPTFTFVLLRLLFVLRFLICSLFYYFYIFSPASASIRLQRKTARENKGFKGKGREECLEERSVVVRGTLGILER